MVGERLWFLFIFFFPLENSIKEFLMEEKKFYGWVPNSLCWNLFWIWLHYMKMIRLVWQVYKAILSGFFLLTSAVGVGNYSSQSSKLLVKVIQEYVSLNFYKVD